MNLRSARIALRVLVILAAPCLLSSLAGCSKSSSSASAQKTYSATGVIKSIAPDKQSAAIAHDAIVGYMSAMTMSFQAGKPGQLDGLAPGDKIAFTFTDEDHKRSLVSVQKAP